MLMKVKEHFDFHQVEPHQRDIDRRLANWGAWCNPGWGKPGVSPMFRMVPPPPLVRGEVAYLTSIVDRDDAGKIAKAVFKLPEKHRQALNWAYVRPCNPTKACKLIGTTMAGLYQYLRDGRQMLINQAV